MGIKGKDGKVEYEGRVLSGPTPDHSRFLMSDYGIGVYAYVWDGERVKRVLVGAWDVPGGGCDEVVVDASEALRAEIAAKAEAKAEADREARLRAAREAEAARVEKGRAVVVVRGRKVAKGTKGVVRWLGSNLYGTSVGLAVEGEDKLVFTAIGNVERDHSPEAEAAEVEAAHESALWIDGRMGEKSAAAKVLAASGVSKGDKVVPASGLYAGKKCRVIWVGSRGGEARVGVVPATKGRFDADWLPVAAVKEAA